MKTAIKFVVLMGIALLAIVLAVILGETGAWYFAWLLGTVVIVLVSAAGGVMLDAQIASVGRSEKSDAH
ncbi:hypothetical protein [Frateuria aurantia]|uniref:Uncharacterized protein n=1 Tax=Frateuria aurantia (strain ATCC 33424 / DSM 6220 / KCTC 2777 / LMG 1558 / NBRC 3245 / NCIMB 13370) TaxID=767434 RepID=H8L6J5_FRAAD|nr:hypothetical protein [Frateuria aurantia]AFC85984.1 hypothetical protein Fraau_1565 [Frateuria aurantia DSM 6220]